MGDQLDIRFRTMMTRIGQAINEDELRNMKFFCKSFVPEKVQQKIKQPTDLWAELENRGMVGPKNVGFLMQMLQGSMHGRTDCLDIVRNYELELTTGVTSSTDTSVIGTSSSSSTRGESTSYWGPDLTREITFLTKHLGHDWKFFMRSLGVSEPELDMAIANHPGNVREQIVQALWAWLYEMQDLASKDRMIDALRDMGRKDLAHKLQKNSY